MSLLSWQWSHYPAGHQDRLNLTAHAFTVPWFMAGTAAVPLAFSLGPWWISVAGVGAMFGAMAIQGRMHRREVTPPQPFRGFADVLARIFLEQWITFPRYVLSGGFALAWRAQPSRTNR